MTLFKPWVGKVISGQTTGEFSVITHILFEGIRIRAPKKKKEKESLNFLVESITFQPKLANYYYFF